MNKLKLLLITGLLAVFPTSLFADGIKVLNAQRAMLSTQYAQDEFTKLDQDADFIADRERLELLQTEGQALVEKFQQDQETLSDEEIANIKYDNAENIFRFGDSPQVVSSQVVHLPVSFGGKNIMLDCGMHMGYNDEVSIVDMHMGYS